jgi:hypothetical protein
MYPHAHIAKIQTTAHHQQHLFKFITGKIDIISSFYSGSQIKRHLALGGEIEWIVMSARPHSQTARQPDSLTNHAHHQQRLFKFIQERYTSRQKSMHFLSCNITFFRAREYFRHLYLDHNQKKTQDP